MLCILPVNIKLLQYCLGKCSKTLMMELDQAQRAVLKVMLCKPFRYSIDTLYIKAEVFRVPQLFILKIVTSVHRSVTNSIVVHSNLIQVGTNMQGHIIIHIDLSFLFLCTFDNPLFCLYSHGYLYSVNLSVLLIVVGPSIHCFCYINIT